MNNTPQFPQALLALHQWVCYKIELDKNGRSCKVPYSPHTGKRASSTNPKTWGTHTDAVNAANQHRFSGIGFVFTAESGIVGIDIDNCLDENGNPNAIAAEILSKLPKTYIEISPSGRGLHIFLIGKMPSGGNRRDSVEIYVTARYFTMTGNRWRDCADIIAEDNGAIAYIHEKFIAVTKPKKQESPPKPPTQPKQPTQSNSTATTVSMSDEELLQKANSFKDKVAFGKLYRGEWQGGDYKSQSEADFALCRKLAFWSGRNAAQIDRIFRTSGLYRDKWDNHVYSDGTTYGSRTVTNACSAVTNVYTPKKAKSANAANTTDSAEISVQNGAYFCTKNQKTYQLTNFTVEPLEIVVADDETQLTCDLLTVKGERLRQTFLSSDFATLPKFKGVLAKKTISLSFLGTEGDLEIFKMFIDNLEWRKKKGVKALGTYLHGGELVFVYSNGAIGVGGKVVDTIVQLEKHKILESDILNADFINSTQLRLLGKHILTYNVPSRTVPLLLWCAGCFIKPHLRKSNIKFPHLFLIGEPGSGKSSSLERIILAIFGKTRVSASSQVTSFTLMKESNSSNIIPQCLDEFKPSKLDKQRIHWLYNHFRDSYDKHGGVRGRADQTQVLYDLLAPICCAGEESADEAAARERTVELLFSKKELKEQGHRESFAWIAANRNILRSFGRSLLDVSLQTTIEEAARWHSEGEEFFSKDFPDRVFDNLCAMYAGMCLINKLCQSLGVAFAEVFPLDHEQCTANLEVAARKYLLDDSTYNKGAVEQAFEVMARMKLKIGEDYAFENGNQYLCIHIAGIYDRYTGYRRNNAVIGEVISDSQFRKQLELSEYFIEKGRLKKLDGVNPKRVWVLNFHKLSAVCDVSGFVKEKAEDVTE